MGEGEYTWKEIYFTFKDNLLWWRNFWNLFAYLPNNF